MQNYFFNFITGHISEFFSLAIIFVTSLFLGIFYRELVAYRKITLLKSKFGTSVIFPKVFDLKDLASALDAIRSVHVFYMKRLGYNYLGEHAHESIIADLIKLFFGNLFFTAIEERLAQASSQEHIVDIKEKIEFTKNKKVYESLFNHDQRILFTTLENGRPLPYQKHPPQ